MRFGGLGKEYQFGFFKIQLNLCNAIIKVLPIGLTTRKINVDMEFSMSLAFMFDK